MVIERMLQNDDIKYDQFLRKIRNYPMAQCLLIKVCFSSYSVFVTATIGLCNDLGLWMLINIHLSYFSWYDFFIRHVEILSFAAVNILQSKIWSIAQFVSFFSWQMQDEKLKDKLIVGNPVNFLSKTDSVTICQVIFMVFSIFLLDRNASYKRSCRRKLAIRKKVVTCCR